MTHLRIELNNIQENVSSAVIEKLYELATSEYLDLSSNLAGNLHTTATYLEYIDALHTAYPDLYISSDNIYIMFEDPTVLSVLLANNIGDGTGVTLTQAASANIGNIFLDNTTITSFNEFNKFTASQSGIKFQGCTNLVNINLSNAVTIALRGFSGCTSLTAASVNTVSSSLTDIGPEAFSNCTNISGVIDFSNTGLTKIWGGLFKSVTTITGFIIPTTVQTYGSSGSNPTGTSNLTIFRGLDNVTELNQSSFGNITHAICCKMLTTSNYFPVLCAELYGLLQASILLLYLPKFKYSSITGFHVISSIRLHSNLCGYIVRDNMTNLTIKTLYFKDILSFKKFDLYGGRFKNLVINNITPPSFDTTTATYDDLSNVSNYSYWNSSIFGAIPTSGANAMTIYVPDSAVATYQADSNYNAYTIRGINEVDPNTNQPYLTRYATNDLWEAAGKPEDALIEEYMN